MRWLCTRPHYDPYSFRDPGHHLCKSLTEFLFHLIWVHRLPNNDMRHWALRVGLIDLDDPGAACSTVFWRWDFWNSQYSAYQKQKKAEKAQRDREAAVELWGRE